MFENSAIRRRLDSVRSLARWIILRVRSTDEPDREEVGFALARAFCNLVVPRYVLTEHAKLWFRDDDFFERYDQLLPGGKYRSSDRKFFLRSLLRLVDGLPGNTAECGAWTGASSWWVCEHFRDSGKTHHVFDSFKGLSQPSRVDGTYWRQGDLSAPEGIVRMTLAAYQVAIHAGWIPDRFDEVADERFCFVHIDVDLYQPTIDSTDFFYERTVPGGIMLWDDYGFETCPGATKAIEEVMASKPEPLIHVPTGQAFIIRQ